MYNTRIERSNCSFYRFKLDEFKFDKFKFDKFNPNNTEKYKIQIEYDIYNYRKPCILNIDFDNKTKYDEFSDLFKCELIFRYYIGTNCPKYNESDNKIEDNIDITLYLIFGTLIISILHIFISIIIFNLADILFCYLGITNDYDQLYYLNESLGFINYKFMETDELLFGLNIAYHYGVNYYVSCINPNHTDPNNTNNIHERKIFKNKYTVYKYVSYKYFQDKKYINVLNKIINKITKQNMNDIFNFEQIYNNFPNDIKNEIYNYLKFKDYNFIFIMAGQKFY